MKPLLVICLLMLGIGCTPDVTPPCHGGHQRVLRGAYPEIHFDLNLRRGQKVDLNGVIGHIIEIDYDGRQYKVRVNTRKGSDDIWFRATDVTVVVE